MGVQAASIYWKCSLATKHSSGSIFYAKFSSTHSAQHFMFMLLTDHPLQCRFLHIPLLWSSSNSLQKVEGSALAKHLPFTLTNLIMQA